MNAEQLFGAAIALSPAVYLLFSKSKWNLIIASYFCIFSSFVVGFMIAFAKGFMGQQTEAEALEIIISSVGIAALYITAVITYKRISKEKRNQSDETEFH